MYGELIKKTLSLLFMLGLILPAVTVYGGDLSRGKAEKMIKEYAQKNYTVKYRIGLGNENGIVKISYTSDEYDRAHQREPLGEGFVNAATMYLELKKKDLMNYEMIRKRVDSVELGVTTQQGRAYFDEFRVELTPKAKPYIIKEYLHEAFGSKTKNVELILGTVDKIEVLRITKPSNNVCHATYKIHYKLTPFGEIYSYYDHIKEQLSRGEQQLPFVLYDDGWRPAQ